MNLSEWADRVGVSKFTAYRWFREGTLPVPAERVGRLILVNVDVAERELARTVLSAQGRRIVVVDAGEVDDDLIRDMTEVLTSFCARLYGRRGARNRAVKALGCAKRDVGPATVES
jgi:predicted site-specific integrase-resolvase